MLNRKRKYWLIGISVTTVVLILVGNIIAAHYKKIVKNALPGAVAEATSGLYRISVKNVSINLLNRRITLRNVHLWPDSATVKQQRADSAAQRSYYDIVIPKLQVSGLMWDKLTGGTGYSCADITVLKPVINVFKTDSSLTKYLKKSSTEIKKPFTVGNIEISGANTDYHFHKGKTFHLTDCNIMINDWELDSKSLNDSSRFMMAEEGDITIGNLLYEPPNSYYRFSAEKIHYNSIENKLGAVNTRLKLKVSEEEFLQHMPEQKEIYDILLPTVELDGIDRYKLQKQKELHISAVYLNHSEIKISLSRLLPENTKSKMGKFPNQLIQKMRLPVNIPVITVNNASIAYSETSDKTGKTATINFDKLSGSIMNVTNIKSRTDVNGDCIANLACKFNKYTDVKAEFQLSLTDPAGAFNVNASLEGLQEYQLTEQTKAFSMLEVRSLNMKSLKLELSGNEHEAKGTFSMVYANLGIKILPEEKALAKAKRRKGFLSFIANNMILYSANPMPGDKLRVIETKVEREPTKSFFNLIWKNILDGVRETTIRDMSIIRWIQKQEKKPKTEEDGQLKQIFKRNKKAKNKEE